MAAAAKALQRMRKDQLNWRIQDLQTVAEANGIEWRRPHGGGSHVIFSASNVKKIVSVPAKRPIKPVYIRHFLALVDTAREVQES